MKPRRFESATTFSMSWSRGTVKLAPYSPPGGEAKCKLDTPHPASPLRGLADLPTRWGGEICKLDPPHTVGRRKSQSGSPLLKDGEDVARRVLEPGNVRASACRRASSNPPCVCQLAVMLELDAGSGQFIHGLVDVVDREVENRIRRGHVVGFGVHEGGVPPSNL